MRRPLPSRRPPAITVLVVAWVVAVITAVLLAASVAEAADATVRLTTQATPSVVTIDVGDAVTIRNDDDERHRLRARSPEDVDTSNLEPGQEAVVSFPVAGRYVLVDERSEDPAYELTVEVRDAGGSAPPDGAPSGGSAPSGDPAPSGGSTTPDGAGGTAPTGSSASAPRAATVTIPDDAFSPRSVTIATGGTVTWENRDGNHTVTARDRSWDSGIFDEGGRYQRRFPDPGTYAYLCLLHPDMTGSVQVVGARAGGSAAASLSGGASGPTATGSVPAPQPSRPAPSASLSPGSPDGSASAEAGTRSKLRITGFAFAPAAVTVAVGDTLVWVNDDEAPHTVTSTRGGPLASDTLATGDRYEVVVEDAGTFAYLCALHPEMVGEVVVTADTAALGEAPAAERGTTGAPVAGGDSSRAGTSPSGTAGSGGGGNLPLVAGIMLLFMGVTFTIGRVSAH